MLVINDAQFNDRSEIIWEKGTNRSAFFKGEVDKYGWVDVGSSFLPAEIISAFLYAQLENLEVIQKTRLNHWNAYYERLKPLAASGLFQLPILPDFAMNNAHMFYLVCDSADFRNHLIKDLNQQGVNAVFHYLSLHKSPFYAEKHDGRALPECDRFADRLVRLPLFYDLTIEQIAYVCERIRHICEARIMS